jgi:hypothetical protein
LGRQWHPEKPYSSPQVHLYVDDARSFLQKNHQKYDLIVFATLDSHTVFSSLSSLRLDNFVFTKESLLSAKSQLNPAGGIAINFFKTKDWLFSRHLSTLEEATGQSPLIYASPTNDEVLLLAGRGFDPRRPLGTTNYTTMTVPSPAIPVESTSDDWPFLFLEKRGFPFHYLLPLLIIFAISFLPLLRSGLQLRAINGQLFFMGAAFFLIETKAVTMLALIFGATWMVNSIVIGSVLVTILFANLLASHRLLLGYPALYSCLFFSLLFNYFFPFDLLNRMNWYQRVFASGIIIALPLFFAALIFAKAFATVISPSWALASNLLGGLIGGLLEYLDMWAGLRTLNLIALLLYVISFVFCYLQPAVKQTELNAAI